MTDEIVPIVDEQDNIIAYKKRADLTKDDIFRISVLWIENSRGQVLISQRSLSKKQFPGMWGAAAAGTVAKGETYEETILREAEEEIGLKEVVFTLAKKVKIQGERAYFSTIFKAVVDRKIEDFVLDNKEVYALKWADKKELKTEVKAHPERFTLAFPIALEIFIK